MKLHHIEITEEIRDHRDSFRDYEALDLKIPKSYLEMKDEDLQNATVKSRQFEIIEWRVPNRIEPTYFGIEHSKLGLFNTLAAMTNHQFERAVKERVETERFNWMNKKHAEYQAHLSGAIDGIIDGIKALPWWKRLLNKF